METNEFVFIRAVRQGIVSLAALCVESDIASENPSSNDAATILLDAVALHPETTFATIVGTCTRPCV